jgi:hypothetical protein
MKNILLAAALLAPLPVLAQTPPPPPVKLFSSAADVQAVIADAKARNTGGNTSGVIANVQGYPVMMEYRSTTTPPSIHPHQAELIEILDGSCTLITGGTLVGMKPGNPGANTLGGTAIEGGVARKVAKGDFIMVPANTPHQYTEVQGLAMMTIHMPVPEN